MSNIWIDKKYANLLPLKGYQLKNNGKNYANLRCPFCGDSAKSQSKKRGWFLDQGDHLSFYCFNCGEPRNFYSFIKELFPSHYSDYIKESYSNTSYKESKKEIDLFKSDKIIVDLTQIKDLPKTHRVIKYCLNRKIPIELIKDCYYSDNFYDWCSKKQPDTFKYECKSDPRLVFPFIDHSGNTFGLSGRTIDFSEVKYLTIKFDEDKPKVFGLERFNPHKKGYIVEGQIDSLFIDNCVGAIGALGNVDSVAKFCNVYDKNNLIVIPDNERRNKQTCNFIKKNLELGYPCVIWPENIIWKDINKMIERGLTREVISDIILKNTYSGISGILKLNQWRRS